jgi:hypothetical protein
MHAVGVQVIVRVRPANDREHSLGGSLCVQPLSATSLRVSSTPEPHTFAFDHVAQQDASQESIFRGAVQGAWREWVRIGKLLPDFQGSRGTC